MKDRLESVIIALVLIAAFVTVVLDVLKWRTG
jgi:hypothetical protein